MRGRCEEGGSEGTGKEGGIGIGEEWRREREKVQKGNGREATGSGVPREGDRGKGRRGKGERMGIRGRDGEVRQRERVKS